MATRIGGEFVSRLSEGALTLNIVRLAGVSIEESTRYNTEIERLLLDAFPDEIAHVWSRVGSAEVATDPMGLELTDIFITLHPRSDWTRADTQAALAASMQEVIDDLPGVNVIFTQPIEMRINEMVAGIRSDIGVKIFGDDFDELVRLSDEVQRILLEIRGASDVSGDQVTGQPVLRIEVDRDALARNGVAAADVLAFVEAVGGVHVGEVFEGQRRFDLVARLPDRLRRDAGALESTLVPTESGQRLPLGSLASVATIEGPATINREWGRRLVRAQCNVVDRDVSSFVAEAQRRIAAEVDLPEGYVIGWGGQFENLVRARNRLAVVVPATLIVVFFLLCFSLKRLRDVALIYTAVPFAAVGGVLALWLRDIPFSVSAAVGFIALSGIAVLNGQVLVSAIREARDRGLGLRDASIDAARQRFRPVLATAVTDALGFIPMAISTGVGAEVQRPLATVVIGGVITSTILTLLVLPTAYAWIGGPGPRAEAGRA
jgi:cobalt-zinc-cadmium resistance protein CzcA